MVDGTTASGSPIVVARVLVYSVIIVAVVLVVDFFAVLLLPLLRDINVWLHLLIWEGLIMILFGVVGIIGSVTGGHHRYFFVYTRRPRIFYGRLKEKVTDLEISIAVAGVMLIILCIFVGRLFY